METCIRSDEWKEIYTILIIHTNIRKGVVKWSIPLIHLLTSKSTEVEYVRGSLKEMSNMIMRVSVSVRSFMLTDPHILTFR